MVGIVIVSHSEKIAEGVVDLCKQMAQDKVKIEAAGGNSDGGIGTDSMKIMNAIKRADTEEGVLILVGIGSSVMSSELAIDLLDEETKKRITIADAPIVEGSVVAAVQASIGNSLSEVKTAAEESKSLNKIK